MGAPHDLDAPIEIRRGNDDPGVIWEFENADGTPCVLAGAFVLEVVWPAVSASYLGGAKPAGRIDHSSDPDDDQSPAALVVEASAGRVTWPLTLAESEAVPRAQGVAGPRYVLRNVRNGKTRDWAGGPVVVGDYLS